MNEPEQDNNIHQILRQAMPDDLPSAVEQRMQNRLATFREKYDVESPTPSFSSIRSLFHKRLVGWAIAAVTTAAIFFAVLFVPQAWHSNESVAWAEVVQAVSKKPWLHFVTTYNDGTQREAWFSIRRNMLLGRTIKVGSKMSTGGDSEGRIVIDMSQNTLDSYDPKENVIVRASDDPFRDGSNPFQSIFSVFLSGDFGKTIDAGLFQLVPEKQCTITKGGKKWSEYHFVKRGKNQNPLYKYKWIVLVDPNTKLPSRWEQATVLAFDLLKTDVHSCHEIDYPSSGPEDMYALGVPKTVKIVDRTLPSDVKRLAKETASSKHWAEDKFSALVVQSSENQHWWQGSCVYHVWKEGFRWRVDHSMGPMTRFNDKAPTSDTDPSTWWREKTKKIPFRPESLCDGEFYWRYDVKTRNPTPADIAAGWPEDTMVLVSTEKHKDRPVNRDYFNVGHILGWGRPTEPMNGLQLLPGIQASIIQKPKAGPPNTVLLEARNPSWKLGNSSELSELKRYPQIWRFWINSAKDYLVMRQEELVTIEGKEVITGGFAIEDVLQDPRGRWYPTVIRRLKCSTFVGTDKWEDGRLRFYYDFTTSIPDSTFKAE
jgi:hypothetical protein